MNHVDDRWWSAVAVHFSQTVDLLSVLWAHKVDILLLLLEKFPRLYQDVRFCTNRASQFQGIIERNHHLATIVIPPLRRGSRIRLDGIMRLLSSPGLRARLKGPLPEHVE